MTPQLAYSKHVDKLNAKARSQIGQIFSQTPILETSLDLALKMFQVYIQPIYEYGASIWTTKVSKNSRMNIDRVFLKYLKRYLGVPVSASNALTYFVTKTKPFTQTLYENPTRVLETINLSIPLSGHQLSLIKNKPVYEPSLLFEELPKEFHESDVTKDFRGLPSSLNFRKKITSKIFDLKHRHLCTLESYHIFPNTRNCKCKICNNPMDWHHPCLPS